MRKAAIAAILMGLWGCADDRSADGGGGIETNNTVQVRILDSLGQGVGAARVRVRPADWTGDQTGSPVPGQILATDASGLAVAFLPKGSWTFEANREGMAALATHEIDGSVSLGELVLAPSARLSGRVALSADEAFAWVSIAGTDHRVRTDSTGRWTMDSLPAGSLGVMVSNRKGAVDSVKLVAGTSDSLPWSGSPALRALDSAGWVLLDDFSKERPSVSAAAYGAVWYMASDREAGKGSRFLRRDGGIDSLWARFLVPGEASQRGAFFAKFDFDSSGLALGSAYMQVGMSFPVAGECLDLGGLDSVLVSLRSTGRVRLEFRSDIHDSLLDYSSYPGADIASTGGSWSTIRLPSSRFQPKSDATHPDIPWARVAGCVLEMRLIASGDLDLELADLRVHGVLLDRFLAGRRK